MNLANYQEYPNFKLTADTLNDIQMLSWQQLYVTTELNRLQVVKEFVKHKKICNWKIRNFINYYGIFGQNISTLKNLRLPLALEENIQHQTNKFFKVSDTPIVRLQVIFGGKGVPLHKDPSRETSFIIPVENHANSFTKFYSSVDSVNIDGLYDPTNCTCVEQIEIVTPTLINTKQIHSVEFDRQYTVQFPRISVTVKWPNCNFLTLVQHEKNTAK